MISAMGQITLSDDPYCAVETFSRAVDLLTVGAEKIKDRLYEASIEILTLKDRHLPPEFLGDFHWICSELTKREASQHAVTEGKAVVGRGGRLGATLRGMRTAKAVAIAERIRMLSDKLGSAAAAE
jgi:hypothetical protein